MPGYPLIDRHEQLLMVLPGWYVASDQSVAGHVLPAGLGTGKIQ